jgi:hypothetical protein
MRRRRLPVLGATVLLGAALVVATSSPPAFAEEVGCQVGQNRAFVNAWLKHDNEEQTLRNLFKFVNCQIGHPPGEGQ